MKNKFIFLFCFISIAVFSQKTYLKTYYQNGTLKNEGWIENNKKIGYWKYYFSDGNLKRKGHYKNSIKEKYWYFYQPNGKRKKEGHYSKGRQQNWWSFYDKNGNVNHKCQLKDNKKNGYCLLYVDKKLIKASKFKKGKKVKEWTDFSSFKKENNLNDLR